MITHIIISFVNEYLYNAFVSYFHSRDIGQLDGMKNTLILFVRPRRAKPLRAGNCSAAGRRLTDRPNSYIPHVYHYNIMIDKYIIYYTYMYSMCSIHAECVYKRGILCKKKKKIA